MAGVFHRAHKGAEHQVKAAGFGEVAAALRADFGCQLVGPKTAVAVPALHQGVGEVLYVAAGNPHLRRHQNGGIQAHHIIPLYDDRLPPGFLDVAF